MTITKPYTFSGGTPISSSEVNADFDELYDALNNDFMDVAASLAFTNTPAGPAADPTSDNQLARKKYVDDKAAAATAAATASALGALFGVGSAVSGDAPPAASTGSFYIQAGTVVANTNVSGDSTINFPTPFPNGCLVTIVSYGDAPGATVPLHTWGNNRVGFFVHTGAVSAIARINYIAIGW